MSLWLILEAAVEASKLGPKGWWLDEMTSATCRAEGLSRGRQLEAHNPNHRYNGDSWQQKEKRKKMRYGELANSWGETPRRDVRSNGISRA